MLKVVHLQLEFAVTRGERDEKIRFYVLLITLLVASVAHGETCSDAGKIKKISLIDGISYIEEQFTNASYACANQAAYVQAIKLSSITGVEAITARLSLREAAINIGNNVSSNDEAEASVELMQAVTGDLNKGDGKPRDELLAAISMFRYAAKYFYTQKYITASLDARIAGIQLDQKLQSEDRIFVEAPSSLIPPNTTREEIKRIDRLIRLAELSKGDKALDNLRYKLVRMIYYGASAYRYSEDEAVSLLRLSNALNDVSSCGSCGGKVWHWKPIINAAEIYLKLGQPEKAKQLIDRVVLILRDTDEKLYIRLYQFNFAFTRVLMMRPGGEVVLPFADEFMRLAKSDDTPASKGYRKKILKTLRTWGKTL